MLPSVSRREWSWAMGVAALVVLVVSLPYLAASVMTPAGYHFTGLLINPIDGHSYLAKMGQGAAGAWLFRLPYTIVEHAPVLVYPFYLLLGHLAPSGDPRILVCIYHLARAVGSWLLLMAVYWLASLVFDEVRPRRYALLLVGLGSGLGWLVGVGPDLTVPEAVTFASLLVNGHFAFTSLLLLWLVFGLTLLPDPWWVWLLNGLAGVWLTWLQPLAVPVVAGVAGFWWLFRTAGELRTADGLAGSRSGLVARVWYHRSLRRGWLRLVLVGAIIAPILAYDWWITSHNPLIGGWMAQNVTLSPPLWQWLTAYGILGVLALLGVGQGLMGDRPASRLLVVWLAVQVTLMLLPLALQRRLSTGLHLPVSLLAAVGLWEWLLPWLRGRWRRWLPTVLLVLVLPSNLLIMAAGLNGVASRNPYVVLSEDQWQALAWLRQHTDSSTVVLADEEMGTLVPPWGGGARVVYGHPFETPDADTMRAAVVDFFAGAMAGSDQSALLQRYGVDLILLQRERYPGFTPPSGVSLAWQSGSASIYAVEAP